MLIYKTTVNNAIDSIGNSIKKSVSDDPKKASTFSIHIFNEQTDVCSLIQY